MDLNHRPLGYEFYEKRNFNELAGVVAYFKEWKIAVRALESSYFGLVLGWHLAPEHVDARGPCKCSRSRSSWTCVDDFVQVFAFNVRYTSYESVMPRQSHCPGVSLVSN